MSNYEWGDNNLLCCCEYYDVEGERSHILGCCCNCQALDEGFDNLITGQRITPHKKAAVMAIFQDRIRIPWRGGAKQVSPDTLAPIILVPVLILIAAYDFILTVAILIFVIVTLLQNSLCLRVKKPKTKFFVSWGIVSFIVIALIFQVEVSSLYEVRPEENLALGIMTALFIFCVYRVRVTARWQQQPYAQVPAAEEPNGEDFCTICRKRIIDRMYHCAICQHCVPERDLHFFWYDCCIGSANNGMFLLSLILAIATLLYSSNSTLTTVCLPFYFLEIVMLPDDCSEVYERYETSICFVSAVYSILMAAYLLWVLLRQILSISLGLTGQEWRQLPFSKRLCFGYKCTRPYDHGFIRNWLRVIRTNDKNRGGAYIST